MATNFPTNIDTFTEQTSSDLITSAKWNNLQDSIEALEVKVGADNSTVTTSHDYKIDALETAIDTKPTERSADITVTVGSGGDYSTINDALAALSAYYPIYVSGGFTATISLLTGFKMAEQVLVSGIDLSWITITSVDAEVAIDRSALTTIFDNAYPAFGVKNGCLPVISALFDMDTSGTATSRHGIYAASFGRVRVDAGCGVKNAGGIGLHLHNNSYGVAYRAVFTGAGVDGARADRNSTLDARDANCGSAGEYGFRVFNGSHIGALSATGTLSQTANTLTANGIIYQ